MTQSMDAPEPFDELARLGDLYALDLLDHEPNERFDRITRVTRRTLGVPTALVSLVDSDRQWFCSRQGLDADETPRRDAFCAHAIVSAAPVMVVEDARLDSRFAANPLVTGPPHIRFYAGAPIISARGHRLGTLCVIDQRPRGLEAADQRVLRDLADLLEREMHYIGLSLLDPLTGLANRRAFTQTARRLLPLDGGRPERISVLCADVDGLKVVNDKRGHPAGDELLRRAARALVDNVPRSDLVARLGGDEFGVLMYDADHEVALETAAAIHSAIERDNVETPCEARLSLSIGAACAGRDEPWKTVIARADRTMYTAKRRGLHLRSIPLDTSGCGSAQRVRSH